jgi:hypothetical protein
MRGLYPASLPVNERSIKHTILLLIIESIPAGVGLSVLEQPLACDNLKNGLRAIIM